MVAYRGRIAVAAIFFLPFYFPRAQETLPLTPEETKNSLSVHLRFESDGVENLVVYRGFVVQYNCALKGPNFVFHMLTPAQISDALGQAARRRSTFWVDSEKLKNCISTNRDYVKSGYDRGHMVPAGDFYWNQLLKNETFTLANISPQSPQLNRGIWNSLEARIRNKVQELNDTAFVITGALFGKIATTIGPGKVGVPSNFYKIVYFPNHDLMFAFLFDNTVSSFSGSLSDFQVSVDNLEALTKQDYYDKLPPILQEQLESQIRDFDDSY